jgi:DNA/RNA endonuclease YhcR with UshA esterase domain
MVKNILILSIIAINSFAFGQTVPIDSLMLHENKTVTTCGKVMSCNEITSKEKKITYLSFGKSYPNNTFTAVIFEKDYINFKGKPSVFFADKDVCITGKVKIYREKPEIILNSEEQIKIQ